MDFAKLKSDAKEKLKGKYGDAITLMILSGVVGAITRVIPADENSPILIILSLVQLVYSCIIGFGIISYFIKISRGEEVTWKELFAKKDMAVAFFVLTFLVGLFTTLWSLLLIIPGIIAAISYSMSSYIKVDNPDMDTMEVIKKSKEMMNGHKMDYFLLNLSFIGWVLLGILTCGILYLWLIPYYSVTMANFYNEIKEKN